MPKINIDMILSDPMLLVGACLVVFGLFLFLVSIWKLLFSSRGPRKKFVVPHEGESEQVFINSDPEPELPEPTLRVITPPPAEAPAQTAIEPPPVPMPADNGAVEHDQEKTVVMQAAETEMQLQLDIIVSQLKNINQKVGELEERLENVPDLTNTPQDIAVLKEPPVNPEDYTKKLLKLAEHVIVLEKEVARLKSGAAKPPVMPL
jgi:hypothetical protein